MMTIWIGSWKSSESKWINSGASDLDTASYMKTSEFRVQCAQKLTASIKQAADFSAFIGLDGFVDEIIHAVDMRENSQKYTRLPTIASMAERIAGAAGKSTNIEFVNERTKLGGNGPIMANALATLGLKVTYVGSLGYPRLHPVFEPFAKRAAVHSISEPGHTDAVEFLDGKVMLVKSMSLNEITWENIAARFGREKFLEHFSSSELIAFVNWTMIPFMSAIWEALLKECAGSSGVRRKIFFDLADPEKRPAEDIAHALDLISKFEQNFDVILGLNEKEAGEIAEVLGIDHKDRTPEGLSKMAREVRQKVRINTLVVHPVTYALAASEGKVDIVEGPVITKPTITTGAGDHFNSGFCLGKLLGFSNEWSLLAGVTTSGFYVKTGQSPQIKDLAEMMCNWPAR
jgi:sugar/nucleoside kinase (ribokinase family)